MKAIRRFTVRVTLPEPLAALHGLMLNLRWSWHRPTADLFASIDPAAWRASGGDPVAMLSALPSARIAALAADGEFLGRLAEAERDLRRYMSEPRWYAEEGEPGPTPASTGHAAIAYFSPEYGITAALPQYSGGLGILAGDHLKSASDLGVPLIGVGLLYRHGYFTQSLSADGWQAERYPSDDPNGLPLELLRDVSGAPVHVTVRLTEGRQLAAQIWVAQVGRVPLLLLDSYVEANEADLHGPAVVAQQRQGQPVGVQRGVVLLLPALQAQALREVARPVEEPDAEDRHAEVGGGLQEVACQDAQAA